MGILPDPPGGIMHIVDVKLMKMHESIGRMDDIFRQFCKNNLVIADYNREKKRCHELMSEISKEVNEPDAETMVSVSR